MKAGRGSARGGPWRRLPKPGGRALAAHSGGGDALEHLRRIQRQEAFPIGCPAGGGTAHHRRDQAA
jgi:hypothetical protein